MDQKVNFIASTHFGERSFKKSTISGAAAPAAAPEGGEAAAKPEEGAEVRYGEFFW